MRKNKNGFTLIELLAVVAIIAILGLIVIPNVIKYYDIAEGKAFIAQGQNLYKAAEQQFIQDRIKHGAFPNGIVYSNVDNPLKLQGGENLEYTIKVNSEGQVTFLDMENGVYSMKVPPSGSIDSNSPIAIDDLTQDKIVAIGTEGSGGTSGGNPTNPEINPNTTNSDGTYNPNTTGIPDATHYEALKDADNWLEGCDSNSKRLNCKILADNKACKDNTEVCYDNVNAYNPYVATAEEGILYNYTSDEKDGNGRYKNGFGLYYTVDRTDMDNTWKKSESVGVGKNYYYRGAVTNNYVKFAGALWQIIRIDERGNIRMIKETSTIQSKWNTETSATYKMKMSYMYGTSSSSPYTNTNNSTIKLALDEIYRKNFDSPSNQTWENFLADPGFCSDKSGDTAPATSNPTKQDAIANYNTRTNKPTYKCKTATDNYTTKTSSFGSKTSNFNYPIGLITYDEVIFAGGKLNTTNTSYYLNKTNEYWTMSPQRYGYNCEWSGVSLKWDNPICSSGFGCKTSGARSQYTTGCSPSQTNPWHQAGKTLNNCSYSSSDAYLCTGYGLYEYRYYTNYRYYSVASGTVSVVTDGVASYGATNTYNTKYVYPVIALKPTVLIESATANGTKTNPYVVGPDTRTWVD